MTKCTSANASMDRWQSARVGRQPGMRFVVVLHLVHGLGRTRLSHSWLVLLLDRRRRPHWRRHRPGAPPRALLSAAQRRCIHRQAGKCRKGRRGCCSMGGELEWTGGVTPGRTCNTRQGPLTKRSFYGIIQQRQHGTARLGQLPLAHTTHSVTQSGLSHLPTQLTKGSVAPSKVNWLHLPPLRDQIRAGTRPALLPILLQLIEYYCCRLRL